MSTEQIAQVVDAKGLSCPMPIVKTAQAVKGLASGQLLEVLATDAGLARRTSPRGRKATGNELVEQTVEGGVYRFVLRKK